MAKKKLTKEQKRKARLRRARKWVVSYQGSDILHDYGKLFKIDHTCAAKDLEAMKASTSEQRQLLRQREEIRIQKKLEEREAKRHQDIEKRLVDDDSQILDSEQTQNAKASPKVITQPQKNPKRRCVNCGRAMRQQFIGLKHCKCGTSWSKAEGYFERTPDMVFALERRVTKRSKNSMRTKQVPVIRYK